jgi:two-component system response regulator GlrR
MGTEGADRPLRRVLLVDDDAPTLRFFERLLGGVKTHRLEVLSCKNAGEALARFDGKIHLVLTDLMLPDQDGGQLLREIHRQSPLVPVLVLTGFASIDRAVELMSAGAFDFLTKPVDERTLLARVGRALETLDLREELRMLRGPDGEQQPPALKALVGQSRAMRALLSRLPLIAGSDETVLLGGESGTGKELAARALHYLSRRAAGPFLAINAGALPEQLFESELFGHVKGAFTDASRDRAGAAVEADGGTLFLDEIGEVTQRVQVKLLRFLQTKEVTPLGSSGARRVDVRIVAATNRDLLGEVRAGRFREDLYYRLSVVPLVLPPLRERREDVPLLAHHLLRRIAREHGKAIEGLSRPAMAALEASEWPGNVRELENVIRRAVVLCQGPVIQIDDLALVAPGLPDDHELLPLQDAKKKAVAAFERVYLSRLFKEAGGNLSHAARLAGADRKVLYALLRKHGLEPDELRDEFRPGGDPDFRR